MQMQDYLPFFQDLFLQYYQFTLENPVYAACLAIAVWLLTTIFYSLRIGFLNRRNRITLKARLDAENALTAAQQEMQELRQEVVASKQQVEQEVQRAVALQERIAGLGGQLSESIVALAAEPELGQQGLSVAPGLEVEHLWQRYSAAVKQLGESLIAQRRTNSELQQSFSAETAKLAEKDSQLQAMQVRLDNQRQQVAKLELAADEHKNQLAQQQQSAEQRLSEVEAKHQADLARLAMLEQQALERAQVKEQQVQEKPKAPEVKAPEISVAQPEAVKPVPVQAPAVEPQQVKAEPKPAVVAAAAQEPTIARAEMVKPKPQAAKADEGSAAGVAGKFKSLFAGAKQQMEKLDDMFGLSTPMLPPEEPKRTTVRVHREPEVVPVQTPVSEPEASKVESLPESAVKEPPGGLTGKFKNLFGSSKVSETATVEEEPAEAVVAVPESEPEPADMAGDETVTDSGKTTNKLKKLFGKFKR